MNVDLISAFDSAANETGQSDASAATGEFPSVLRSTLDGERASRGRDASAEEAGGVARDASLRREADRAGDRPATTEAADEASSQAGEAERERVSEDEARDLRERGSAEVERVARELEADEIETATAEPEPVDEGSVEAAVAGGAAAALADGLASGRLSEATEAGSGRLSALEAEADDRELVDRGVRRAADSEIGAGVSRGGAIDEAAARAAIEEAAAAETASVAAREGAAAEIAGSRGGEARVGRNAASDERVPGAAGEGRASSEAAGTSAADSLGAAADASSEDARGREEAPTDRNGDEGRNEQALFDRAAEGAQSAGVDPDLRAAIVAAEEAQRAPATIPIEAAPALASPVAGAVTETTTATPGQPTPPVASDAISVQTEWLATRGGGSARLMLHPPELGELAIRVTLRGGAVEVVMIAQEAIAQTVAEEQSERLAQAFANRDLRMESFEVRRGNPDDLPDAATGRFADEGGGREGRDEDETASRGAEGAAAGGTATSGTTPLDATMPRILSAGREAGVDLRI